MAMPDLDSFSLDIRNLDKIELGLKALHMHELQYLAAIYDKKLEINLVD